jgi:hypothetical protein
MLRLLEAPTELRLPSPLGRRIGRLVWRAAPVLDTLFEDGPLRRLLRRWRNSLKKLMTRRVRARLKPIRWFFNLWLRAAILVRVRRLLPRRQGVGQTSATWEGESSTPDHAPISDELSVGQR